jgi:hypothetical protein
MARPTIYNDELGTKICKRIAEGESVREIVKNDEMPSSSTIFNWLLDEDKKVFLEQYETARNIQAETMFEELIEIADRDSENVMRDRLKVDTRKWYLSKVLPKKFGEKMEVENTGNININMINYGNSKPTT